MRSEGWGSVSTVTVAARGHSAFEPLRVVRLRASRPGHGQRYLLCRNDTIPVKYPRKPVTSCLGYEPASVIDLKFPRFSGHPERLVSVAPGDEGGALCRRGISGPIRRSSDV